MQINSMQAPSLQGVAAAQSSSVYNNPSPSAGLASRTLGAGAVVEFSSSVINRMGQPPQPPMTDQVASSSHEMFETANRLMMEIRDSSSVAQGLQASNISSDAAMTLLAA